MRPQAPLPTPTTSTSCPSARQMLAAEVRLGGRLSDPHDVPGIVLNLAKDLPAAAAVSVVRIDEEIELVGNTIDPDVDPNLLATVFSGVFRTLQQAAGMLASGPLGRVHDVVIEAEHMDLVLRPLGTHYYLLVLEDRRQPEREPLGHAAAHGRHRPGPGGDAGSARRPRVVARGPDIAGGDAGGHGGLACRMATLWSRARPTGSWW